MGFSKNKKQVQKIVIVIPTYNEVENIYNLVLAIQEQLQQLRGYNIHILIVDDSSPDDTAQIVRELQTKYFNLYLLDNGGGQGFQYAISNLSADVVFEFDTNFSHNSADIEWLLQEINIHGDFVVGSYYVRRGSIPKKWGMFRKLKASNMMGFVSQAISLRFSYMKPQVFLFLSIIVIFVFSYVKIHTMHLTFTTLLTLFTLLISLCTVVYGVISTLLMQYMWENGSDVEKNSVPLQQEEPFYSFTALIPARDEVSVIGDTIKAINDIAYPEHLKEALIICREDDRATIKAANDMIFAMKLSNVRVITFSDDPINKPHSLNIGLREATKNIIVVFDAEDQPHANIYRIANTLFQTRHADVLQSGVQLMNFKSHWYSTLNVLEYFFWFKSTLHFFARQNAIPLGGNTVFFKKNLLKTHKGWDESCLTEDAEIGLRLSVAGANIQVFYDQESVTREETPVTTSGFIKQRTRWNQGFIQIFLKGTWLQLPTFSQRLCAFYILISPFIQAINFVLLPILIYIAFVIKLPVEIVLLSFLPLYIQVFQIILYMIGFYLFLQSYNITYPLILIPLRILSTFYFFQFMLSISAIRALLRTLISKNGWEKTHHSNIHRETSSSLTFS